MNIKAEKFLIDIAIAYMITALDHLDTCADSISDRQNIELLKIKKRMDECYTNLPPLAGQQP